MAATQRITTVQGITLLLLEPDVIVRLAIADYLRDCGHKVIEGATADDALAVLRAGQTIDVILCEVQLAGKMDGFALARYVRAHHRGVDVVLASGIPGTAAKARDLCDEGPLAKPYEPREIVRRINILTVRRRTARDGPGCTADLESTRNFALPSEFGLKSGLGP
jgi:DNA-binding response OmpR family regulator